MVSIRSNIYNVDNDVVQGSNIVRYNVLGNNIVVLNSLHAVTDLLDKRSAIYSDRYACDRAIDGVRNNKVSARGCLWYKICKHQYSEVRHHNLISSTDAASTGLLP